MIESRRDEDPLCALDAGLAAEIRASALEVDATLIEEMRVLTLKERIAWSSGRARTLALLRGGDGAR